MVGSAQHPRGRRSRCALLLLWSTRSKYHGHQLEATRSIPAEPGCTLSREEAGQRTTRTGWGRRRQQQQQQQQRLLPHGLLLLLLQPLLLLPLLLLLLVLLRPPPLLPHRNGHGLNNTNSNSHDNNARWGLPAKSTLICGV